MKIQIIKCDSPNFWYSDKIGEVFEVEETQMTNIGYSYQVKKIGAVQYFVNANDCIIGQIPDELNDLTECYRSFIRTHHLSNKWFQFRNDWLKSKVSQNGQR